MPLPLPPNVSAANFRAALVKFKEAIGNRWVFDSEEDVLLYRDGYSPLRDEPEELLPSAAVAPQSVEEVQAIVRIANEFHRTISGLSLFRYSRFRRAKIWGTVVLHPI